MRDKVGIAICLASIGVGVIALQRGSPAWGVTEGLSIVWLIVATVLGKTGSLLKMTGPERASAIQSGTLTKHPVAGMILKLAILFCIVSTILQITH
jgi:hypothetical protein